MQTTRYQSVFTVERIELMSHIGIYDDERAKTQPVRITFRLYFPTVPDCFTDDHASFVNYQTVVEMIAERVESKAFRLIEYLTHELYSIIREFLDKEQAEQVKIWLSVCKVRPDIKQMQGGASFIYSDLPENADVVTVA